MKKIAASELVKHFQLYVHVIMSSAQNVNQEN